MQTNPEIKSFHIASHHPTWRAMLRLESKHTNRQAYIRCLIVPFLLLALLSSGCAHRANPAHNEARQIKEFNQLVGAGKFDEAEAMFEKGGYTQWWNEKSAAVSLAGLIVHANAQYEGDFAKDETDLNATGPSSDRTVWPGQRQSIQSASNLVKKYESQTLFANQSSRSLAYGSLKRALTRTTERLSAHSVEVFWANNNFQSADFFDVYPVTLDRNDFFNSGAFLERMQEMNREDLLALKQRYPFITQSSRADAIFTDAIVASAINKGTSTKSAASVSALLASIAELESGGTGITSVPSIISIYDVQAAPSGDFSVSTANATPVTAGKDAIRRAAMNAPTPFSLFVIPLSARTDRMAISTLAMASTYLAGYRTDQNPAYNAALFEAQTAQQASLNAQVNSSITANNPYANGWAQLGAIIGNVGAASRYDQAMQALRNTPQTFQVPVHADYNFTTTIHEVKKTFRYEAILVAKANLESYVLNASVEDSKRFEVAHGLRPDDDKYKNGGSYQTEQDLSGYATRPEAVPASTVFRRDQIFQRAKSLNEAIEAATRPAATTQEVASQSGVRERQSSNAPLLQGVVVIKTGASLGAGFYIRDNMVITNEHVVSGSPNVTIEDVGGNQSQGIVIASDHKADLALIGVSRKGVPLKMYSGGDVSLGASLIAIGHPKGLLFSVTRGIVSGIRDIESVRYLQTDAPINPGNSGGPIMINGQVVGVADWKRADSEGLGFAIYYTEVVAFLARSGIGRP